jgi:hypothetical protein
VLLLLPLLLLHFCERKTLTQGTIRVKILSQTTFSTSRMALVTAKSKRKKTNSSSFFFIRYSF